MQIGIINNFIYHAKLCKLTYNKNNTFIIIRKNNSLNICFRGTKNLNDLYLNFNIIPQSFLKKEIKVHKGFLYKYLSIRDLVINKSKEIGSKVTSKITNRKIFFLLFLIFFSAPFTPKTMPFLEIKVQIQHNLFCRFPT